MSINKPFRYRARVWNPPPKPPTLSQEAPSLWAVVVLGILSLLTPRVHHKP